MRVEIFTSSSKALGFYDMRAVCMSGGYKNTHTHMGTIKLAERPVHARALPVWGVGKKLLLLERRAGLIFPIFLRII